MGLVDIVVAACILMVLVGYGAQTFWYGRKTASYTERIDNLRTLRQIVATVTRDLEGSLEIQKPSYGTTSLEVVFRDVCYAQVRYMLVDDAGVPIRTDDGLNEDPERPVWLVRTVDSEDPSTGRRVAPMCRRLHSVRFARLGRNLVGLMVRLKRTNESPGEERTLRLDTLVAVERTVP